MPQPHERNRTQNTRAQRPETAAGIVNAQFGDVCGRIKAVLAAQKQMMDVLHDVSHAWFIRATSQTELAFKLPARLTAAQTIPDVMSAYRQWLSEWIDVIGEDNRRLLADGNKVIDQGIRCFTLPSSGMTT